MSKFHQVGVKPMPDTNGPKIVSMGDGNLKISGADKRTKAVPSERMPGAKIVKK